jgi:hypothetical protein
MMAEGGVGHEDGGGRELLHLDSEVDALLERHDPAMNRCKRYRDVVER